MKDQFFIVYVLRSKLDGKNYAGFTANLEKEFRRTSTAR
jgi:predicted GIY-YIG superfamily endonuclease